MDPDERLAAAVGGAARYFADAAGLANEVILQLQGSVVSACKQCFLLVSSARACEVSCLWLVDRIQVELVLPESNSSPEKAKQPWTGIDEVLLETRGNSRVLRLTKFVAAAPPVD
jgi:hypothetical protein